MRSKTYPSGQGTLRSMSVRHIAISSSEPSPRIIFSTNEISCCLSNPSGISVYPWLEKALLLYAGAGVVCFSKERVEKRLVLQRYHLRRGHINQALVGELQGGNDRQA